MIRWALLLAAACVLGCGSSSSIPPSTRMAATTSSDPLTVVTANLRNSGAKDGLNDWTHRKDALLSHLHGLHPDFLGVQEALADQQDALVAAFPEYTSVGVGRDDGHRKGEFASLFLANARFTVLDSGNLWLSPTPTVPGSKGWDAALTRICSYALVRDNTNQKELLLANTHFDHVGVQAREESAKLIAAGLPALYPAKPALPMILTGDFNSHDDSSAYAAILANGLLDAYRQVHPTPEPNESSFHDFKGGAEGKRIDFIFHTKDFKTTASHIDRTQRAPNLYLSDHYFVEATLEWK